MKETRILIVDDHYFVRRGIRMFLDTEPTIKVIGEAENGREAVQQANKLRPDIILMDLLMPGGDGIEAITTIKSQFPTIKILVLTMCEHESKVRAAMETSGADGYLLKDEDENGLLQAIAQVQRGETPLHPRIAHFLTKDATSGDKITRHANQLTDCEKQILHLMGRGESNTAIAKMLHFNAKIVNIHISNIFEKLDVSSWAEAIIRAVQMGLIFLDDCLPNVFDQEANHGYGQRVGELLYHTQLQMHLGQPCAALDLLDKTRQILTQKYRPDFEVIMSTQMGIIHVQRGDYFRANQLLQQAHRASTNDTPLLPELCLLSSALLVVSDNVSEAIEAGRQALDGYELQHNLYGQMQALINLAGLLVDHGRMSEAGSLLARSLHVGKTLGTPHHLNVLHTSMSAHRLWLSGHLNQAEQVLAKQEAAIQNQLVSPLFLIKFLQMRGVVYRDQGAWTEAEAYLKFALAMAVEQNVWTLAPGIIKDMAWLQSRRGNLELAWDLARQAQALLVEGNVREQAQVYTLLGAVARERGQYQAALFYLESAQKIFEAMDFKLGLWSNQLHLAQIYLDLGYEKQATESLTRVLSFASQNGINGAYFWDPVVVVRLCVYAIAKEIEALYAISLANKLAEFLTIDDVMLLNKPDQPQIYLSYIYLLKAMGTPKAQQHLYALATSTTLASQIRKQAEQGLPQSANQLATAGLPEIRIYGLGALQVERNGQLIEGNTWAGKSKAGRQKVKTLLAFLVEQGKRGATKDQLIEALWGSKAWGRDEAKLESSLARTLSALRQVLEPDLVPPATSSFILTEDGRYYLNTELCWIDIEEFQRLIKVARDAKLRDDKETAQEAYKKALTLYRGEYLRDVPRSEEWAGIQKYALSQQLGIALTTMGSYYLDQGIVQKALSCYQDAIKEEPTNEIAHYQFIKALQREGRIEDAILAYQRCRKIFNQEVDEEPPETITELYESIELGAGARRTPNHAGPRRSRTMVAV